MSIRFPSLVRTFFIVAAHLVVRGSPVSAGEPVDAVNEVRSTLGLDEFEKLKDAVRLTGSVEFLGQKGRFDWEFDAAGRFSRSFDTPISIDTVFDGKTVLNRDIGDEVCEQALGDRIDALLSAWAATGHWFSSEHQASFKPHREADTDGNLALSLHLGRGRADATVLIDRKSMRPIEWKVAGPHGMTTVTLEGKIQAGPLVLPQSITSVSESGQVMTMKIEKADIIPAVDWSKKIAALKQPDDTTFDRSAPAALETKRAPTGHVLVHPLLNGKDYGWFIFDTGAGQNVLDNRTIKSADLKALASIPAVGIGGAAEAVLCRPDSFQLGPMTIRKPLMVGMDLAFLDTHMGEKIAGVIGYGTLARCVAEIDLPASAISIFDPAEYKLAAGKWSPLILYDRVPCVPGRFEGHDAVFRLDTGAGGSVAFHAPTVDRLKLTEKRKTHRSMVGGVGGFKPAREGKIKWLEFGGQRHKKVDATFATETHGAFGDACIDANIGGDLIGKSLIVMDYPGARIAFQPKAKKSADKTASTTP